MGWTKYIPFLKAPAFPLCSDCFKDNGLRLEANDPCLSL
jgi:hypothetical protein